MLSVLRSSDRSALDRPLDSQVLPKCSACFLSDPPHPVTRRSSFHARPLLCPRRAVRRASLATCRVHQLRHRTGSLLGGSRRGGICRSSCFPRPHRRPLPLGVCLLSRGFAVEPPCQ